MALKFPGKRSPADPYLIKPIKTARFNLVNCNFNEAVKVTLPWRQDKEVLHNLMMRKDGYTRLEWIKAMGRPDGNTLFYHAIVSKEARGTIGTHRVKLNRHGTASMAIVIHARSWWGKDVFEEVRTGILDHFSASEKVERFYGRVLSRNFSSIYNYTKLGFRLIGYDKSAWRSPVTKEFCDTMHYEMLVDDWIARQAIGAKDE
jgi:RimJ/RimL family protein N-acetyltransferase